MKAINRWQKTLFLVLHPKLQAFSAKGHEPCDLKAVKKDIKCTQKEEKKQADARKKPALGSGAKVLPSPRADQAADEMLELTS